MRTPSRRWRSAWPGPQVLKGRSPRLGARALAIALTLAGALPLAAAVSALVAVGAPAARADGDPASDILLASDVFFPYSPPTSGPLMRRLSAAALGAARAGAPVKVALIATPVDLGAIPSLFGRPQQYAGFLDQEISFERRQPLLVVMPNGYGTAALPPAAKAATARLAPPTGRSADALATAALTAVARIAAAEGHPLGRAGTVNAAAGRREAGAGFGLVAGLVAAAVLGAVATWGLLRRRRTG
jgi:hypothetical protein